MLTSDSRPDSGLGGVRGSSGNCCLLCLVVHLSRAPGGCAWVAGAEWLPGL